MFERVARRPGPAAHENIVVKNCVRGGWRLPVKTVVHAAIADGVPCCSDRDRSARARIVPKLFPIMLEAPKADDSTSPDDRVT
jgi:hypothetical protein